MENERQKFLTYVTAQRDGAFNMLDFDNVTKVYFQEVPITKDEYLEIIKNYNTLYDKYFDSNGDVKSEIQSEGADTNCNGGGCAGPIQFPEGGDNGFSGKRNGSADALFNNIRKRKKRTIAENLNTLSNETRARVLQIFQKHCEKVSDVEFEDIDIDYSEYISAVLTNIDDIKTLKQELEDLANKDSRISKIIFLYDDVFSQVEVTVYYDSSLIMTEHKSIIPKLIHKDIIDAIQALNVTDVAGEPGFLSDYDYTLNLEYRFGGQFDPQSVEDAVRQKLSERYDISQIEINFEGSIMKMQIEFRDTVYVNESILIQEGVLGAVAGGVLGFTIGPKLGECIANALGAQKGVFRDMLTSRVFLTALGAYIGGKK